MDATRRAAVAAALVAAAGLASACGSLRDQAVPGCPVCGDPVTVTGADGLGHVLPRLRLRGDGDPAMVAFAFGVVPWTLEREEPAAAPAAR